MVSATRFPSASATDRWVVSELSPDVGWGDRTTSADGVARPIRIVERRSTSQSGSRSVFESAWVVAGSPSR
jgi:hypothetical protein